MLRIVTQYIINIAIFYTKNCLYKYREKKEKENKYRFYLLNTTYSIYRTTRLNVLRRAKMTIGAINTRLLSLTMYKSNLEFSITSISNRRQQIAYQTMQLADADWESDPRVQQLQAMDQYLELQQKNLETQQKAATSELESMQKILDTNVKKDFTLNLNA